MAETENQLPKGFTDVSSKPFDYWYDVNDSGPVQGLLMSRRESTVNGKKKAYYTLKLTKPCKARIKDEATGVYNLVDVSAGDILGVDERADLLKFKNLVDGEYLYEVFVLADEKIALDNGNTFWRFKLGSRQTNMATGAENVPF